MRPLLSILVLAAAATSSQLLAAPGEMQVLVGISFLDREVQSRRLSCGERAETHLISVQSPSGSTGQQQATITMQLDVNDASCSIRIVPPLNPRTSEIDWFLPLWAVDTQPDFERQMQFSVTPQKGAAATLFTRRTDWLEPRRQPMNEFSPIGFITFRMVSS